MGIKVNLGLKDRTKLEISIPGDLQTWLNQVTLKTMNQRTI